MKKLRSDFAEYVGGHEIKYADPIIWDILTSYLAYTIVLDDSGNAYMSIKDTPAGINLDNEDYWLSIGNFYQYVPDILEEESIYPQIRVADHKRFYIDNTNGNDSNSGTYSNPFKTIDRFMEESKKYTQIRATVLHAGTYKISSGNTMSGLVIQISASVPNVIIELPCDSINDFAYYNGYLRLDGLSDSERITLVCPPVNGIEYGSISAVNSLFRFEYANVPYNRLTANGGTLQLLNSSFNNIYGHDGEVHLYTKINVLNTNPSTPAITLLNSDAVFSGNWETTNLIANSDQAFIDISGGDLYIDKTILSDTVNKYKYAIKSVGAFINIKSTTLAEMGDRATDGNVVDANTHRNFLFTPDTVVE